MFSDYRRDSFVSNFPPIHLQRVCIIFKEYTLHHIIEVISGAWGLKQEKKGQCPAVAKVGLWLMMMSVTPQTLPTHGNGEKQTRKNVRTLYFMDRLRGQRPLKYYTSFKFILLSLQSIPMPSVELNELIIFDPAQ